MLLQCLHYLVERQFLQQPLPPSEIELLQKQAAVFTTTSGSVPMQKQIVTGLLEQPLVVESADEEQSNSTLDEIESSIMSLQEDGRLSESDVGSSLGSSSEGEDHHE